MSAAAPVSVVRDANLACPRASRRRTALAAAMAPNGSDLRKLAIVPAYNEQGMVGRVVREIRRQAPGFDVVVVDDGSTDAPPPRPRPAEPSSCATRSTPGSAGRCSRASSTRCATATTSPPRWTATASTSRPTCPTCSAKLQTSGDEADMVCGSRFRGDPGYKVPIGRRIGNLIFSVVLTAISRQRITDPTSGFRMTNRRGIELFARDYPHDYPGGRGDPDAPRPPPAHPRGAGADERPRLRPQLDRLSAERLLHGQGAAGAVRRPVPPPPDAGRGARRGRAGRAAGRRARPQAEAPAG